MARRYTRKIKHKIEHIIANVPGQRSFFDTIFIIPKSNTITFLTIISYQSHIKTKTDCCS